MGMSGEDESVLQLPKGVELTRFLLTEDGDLFETRRATLGDVPETEREMIVKCANTVLEKQPPFSIRVRVGLLESTGYNTQFCLDHPDNPPIIKAKFLS
ncbi:unnamed protein product [marine sediment metagenome]|uniref:Uncharacterized protein n=1 Tax=marine sediment metagenome TaxID=412755 RepID=X1AX72_9ZZZZ